MKNLVLRHKIISAIIVLVLIFVGYKIYASLTNTSGQTHYVIAAVEKGTIIKNVSGTGQVSANSQVELKPKASGEIIYLGAKTGDYVNAGQLIMQIDSRNAVVDLQNAKLNLQKMIEGQGSGLGGSGGLAKDYEDAFSHIDATFSDLTTIMPGFDSIINNYQASPYKMNLPDDLARSYYSKTSKSYYLAKTAYDKTLAEYKGINRPLSNNQVITIVNDTYTMLQLANQLAKDASVYLAYTYDQLQGTARSSALITDKGNVDTWFKTINSDLSTIGADHNTLKNSALDIESQRLAVEQKEYAYQDYFLYAPFSGLVQISATQNDTVSNGSSIGTIVSNKKIATIALNEVDIAKVKVGQKATLSFDAIDGLSITGQVAETDIIGTVSQGVVTYNVKIAFDTQDNRVRSGMSVSADIATDVKQDVTIVPSGAVKTQGSSNYVEVVASSTPVTTGNQGVILANPPQSQEVTIGLSDDTNTEILTGLSVGDKIVSRTIAGTTAAKTTATAPSLFGSAGGRAPH